MPRTTSERATGVIAVALLILYCASFGRRAPGNHEPLRVVVHRRHAIRRRQGSAAPPPSTPNETEPYALDTIPGLRRAATLAGTRRELILTTSDWNGVGSAVNLGRQLARFGLDRQLLLQADTESTCKRVAAVWPWLACGYSHGIPGFSARYASLGMPLVNMWNLWSAKWLTLARLCELGLNVMMMDSDILVLADPYRLLHHPPLDKYALILPPEGERVNVGYIYARGSDGGHVGSGRASRGGLHSLLWDVVRRLRLFIELQTLTDRNGHPSVSGLWDQGLFSDALLSSVLGKHTYPFTWLHSPSAFAGDRISEDGRSGLGRVSAVDGWPPAGFTVANASSLWRSLWRRGSNARGGRASGGAAGGSTQLLAERPVEGQTRTRGRRPPWPFPSLPATHPQIKDWASEHPMLWNEMRLNNPWTGIPRTARDARPDLLPGWATRQGWIARATVGAEATGTGTGTGTGAGTGGSAPTAMDRSSDLVVAAPDWLHCTTGHWMVTAGWLSADRPVCAVLHLVESRSQFVHFGSLDTLKANRPYVMRAHGHWHADASILEDRKGQPPDAATLRSVRLGSDVLSAAASSNGLGVLLNALQLLASVAALTGRTPVVPSVPCGSRWLKRHPMTPNGVADDSVLQLRTRRGVSAGDGPGDGGVACHLAIGGARCALPNVLPAWQPLGGTRPGHGAENLTASRIPIGDYVDELRTRAHQVRDVPMLEITLADIVSGGSAGQGAANVNAHRFRCGLPVAMINESYLQGMESTRLEQLQQACPAFFAPRGTSRRQLDWLHRRRMIADDHSGCK